MTWLNAALKGVLTLETIPRLRESLTYHFPVGLLLFPVRLLLCRSNQDRGTLVKVCVPKTVTVTLYCPQDLEFIAGIKQPFSLHGYV